MTFTGQSFICILLFFSPVLCPSLIAQLYYNNTEVFCLLTFRAIKTRPLKSFRRWNQFQILLQGVWSQERRLKMALVQNHHWYAFLPRPCALYIPTCMHSWGIRWRAQLGRLQVNSRLGRCHFFTTMVLPSVKLIKWMLMWYGIIYLLSMLEGIRWTSSPIFIRGLPVCYIS